MTRPDYSSPESAIRIGKGIIFPQQICPETRRSLGIDLGDAQDGTNNYPESFLLQVAGVLNEAENSADGAPGPQRLDDVYSDRVVRVSPRDDGPGVLLETVDPTEHWVQSVDMNVAPTKQRQSEDTR